ncbi:MaoC/PaaZ C-terminal domain-containing protein [Microterricola pindariensis]|uniref:MaoC-like domain-containing protein n=1 Tax=Microterricola pindariensis TaxID=478010 RepID=A0ABX5AWC1_9MICO|nr:MaoC/PaaZ C-terminal domain-containing protein [Microterricola pindariensis]PPL19197.1 hypothetical protein GY24_06965 [Microterricola pindariensis]
MKTTLEIARLMPTMAPGTTLGLSRPIPLTQGRIDDFAEITGDRQWIHVDAERASSGPYAGTIAHGYLILALLPEFTRDVVDFASQGTVINYGLNRVRFLAAAGSGIQCIDRITLMERTDKTAGTLYGLQHELMDAETGDVLCLAQTLTLVRAAA